MPESTVSDGISALYKGQIIFYPTEAVYGLGCDPFQRESVFRLAKIKQRDKSKNFILVASCWNQVAHLIGNIPYPRLQQVFTTWPGPYTWVFPARTDTLPEWLSGEERTVALRISSHPIIQSLCEKFGGPIVSTSANLSGGDPVLHELEARKSFSGAVSVYIPGELGTLSQPTEIRSALTGKRLR